MVWPALKETRYFERSSSVDNYLNLKFESLCNQRRIAYDILQDVTGEIQLSEEFH